MVIHQHNDYHTCELQCNFSELESIEIVMLWKYIAVLDILIVGVTKRKSNRGNNRAKRSTIVEQIKPRQIHRSCVMQNGDEVLVFTEELSMIPNTSGMLL